jgi:hypothetical protein
MFVKNFSSERQFAFALPVILPNAFGWIARENSRRPVGTAKASQ